MAVQRIIAEGDLGLGWPANGVSCSTDPHAHLSYTVTADGEGGVIVAWQDYRTLVNPPYVDIYAQHVTASGTIVPGWAADGVRLTGAPNGQINAQVCADGAGGAIITWQDYRSGNSNADIYAQHINGAGTIASGWDADGVVICNSPGDQTFPLIVADGAGGAVIAWNGPSGPHAQRITATGALASGWPVNGMLLTGPPSDAGVVALAPDGAGGAIAGLLDFRTLPPGSDPYFYSNIYAQHVTGTGTIAAGWPADGMPVCVRPDNQGDLRMAPDGAGGALLVWDDYRTSIDSDIYLQRVNGDGTLSMGWPVDGLRVSTALGHQFIPQLAADGSGGAYVTYEELSGASGGYYKVYAQHVTGAGTLAPGWVATGTPLASTGGVQTYPSIVADDRGGAIVAWQDGRDAYYLIYAQRLEPDGPVAVALSLVSAEAEPDQVRLTWQAADGAGITATVERRSATTSFQSLGTIVADGTGRIEYVDDTVTPGERYAYRLRYRDGSAEAFSPEAWVDVPRTLEFALEGLRPNPSSGDIVAAFSLPSNSTATLDVLDVSGRRIAGREVGALGAGRHVVRLTDGHSVPPGMYWLRLTQGARVLLARGVVVR